MARVRIVVDAPDVELELERTVELYLTGADGPSSPAVVDPLEDALDRAVAQVKAALRAGAPA